jgi:hypothetical protein
MRRLAALGFVSLAAFGAASTIAEAQPRRLQEGGPLILRVRPRSFLDAGTVVEPGSLNRTTSGFAQTQAYLVSPPWSNHRDRFGEGVLPDPVTNGPFVGARNPFGPVDYVAPFR